jgi:membrane-associated phospholipid phosphatase
MAVTGTAAPVPPARPAVPSSLRSSLSPADKVVVAYLTIIAALILIFASRIPIWWVLVAAHCAAISIVFLIGTRLRGDDSEAAIAAVSTGQRFSRWIRSWYPLFLIPMTYKELGYLIPRVHPRDLDWQLDAIDIRIFGADPALWLERVISPVLTEILQLAYICYYILPVVLGIVLWRRRSPAVFDFYVYLIVLGFYLSYLGYLSVPAIGPRFILADQFTKPLGGLLVAPAIRRALDHAEGITRDCFPSGHTELTMLVLYSAWRFHRPTFRWMLPVGTALIISTVYLRYHYVIDVVAGALLAMLIMAGADFLYRKLGGRDDD